MAVCFRRIPWCTGRNSEVSINGVVTSWSNDWWEHIDRMRNSLHRLSCTWGHKWRASGLLMLREYTAGHCFKILDNQSYMLHFVPELSIAWGAKLGPWGSRRHMFLSSAFQAGGWGFACPNKTEENCKFSPWYTQVRLHSCSYAWTLGHWITS